MQSQSAISIYNASAGAGKTFALVRNYLIILFKSKNEYKYRNILAITFTNKAVAEMKSRIVKNLQQFSDPQILQHPSIMFEEIKNETSLEPLQIQLKAGRILKNIVQDYASFDVVTIDTFTHRIIRTFARDLRIPQNFEVELNTVEVLEQAVDNLIDSAGEDPMVTPILLEYALEKTNDDKSWDISRDFYDISKLLLSENDRKYILQLEDKSLEDFGKLKDFLYSKAKKLESQIKNTAAETIDFISENGLLPEHFKGRYLPKALDKISQGDYKINTQSGWIKNLGQEPLYTKTQKQPIKDILDQVSPEIASSFLNIKETILQLSLIEELLKRLTPLSVLQAINKEVQKIKAEKNLVLISDFNQIINKNIANQPTPFIYERLGERYQHYFIDEFQDTSVLQWENMIPLIDNAVSAEINEEIANSLMLVGDPKQAIYRWRGGYAEQFIELSGIHNPFQNRDKAIVDLEFNYRSFDEIINFNNAFFSHTAGFLDHPNYSKIYVEGNNQKLNPQKGGFVSISFVEANTLAEANPLYLEKTLETVTAVLERGFRQSEICILVRRNSEGVAIAQHLQENNIQVVSNESLLLINSPEVCFIVNVLQFLLQPNENTISIQLLEYLAEEFLPNQNPHEFYIKYLKLNGQQLFEELKTTGIEFQLELCSQLPLYEAVEYIVRSFNLNEKGGAYLQFFLDHVYAYDQKNDAGIHGFVAWWENKKDNLSISTPANTEAIQIMTIHKAKGLEFPVVIYPFAESDIYPRSDNMNWYQTKPEEYLDFKALLISQKKDLLDIDEHTANLYNAKREQQQLDNLNILYVALTRAVEQLYIISRVKEKYTSAKEQTNFADLLMTFLEVQPDWEASKMEYSFGESKRISSAKNNPLNEETLNLISSAKESHNIDIVTRAETLWDNDRQEAISMGNLVHDLMSQINTIEDIDETIKKAHNAGMIISEERSNLKQSLLNLIDLLINKGFFDPKKSIYNERDILHEGALLRPDRVEIDNDKYAYLLDYKTGLPQESHKNQINAYASALKSMGLQVVKKIIVYVNEDQPLLEV